MTVGTDKWLYLLCSFVITIISAHFIIGVCSLSVILGIVLGSIISAIVGIGKEFWENKYGTGFDYKNLIADTCGIMLAIGSLLLLLI